MGLMGAIGAGIAEAGGTVAKIGLEQIRAAVEADRDARLNEMRSQFDATVRSRNKADAAAERERVAEFSKPIEKQPNGLIAQNAGLNDADAVGTDENVGVNVQKTSRDSTQRERQNRALIAGDLMSAERFGKDADRSEDNALNARKLDEAARRQDAWNANEAAKRENEARRIEALFAKISAKSEGNEKTPTRVAEAQQIMDNINKERIAAGKPTITFEDALAMHFRAADPAKETVTYQGDDPVPMERKVTRPIGSKEGTPRKVVKFGDLK